MHRHQQATDPSGPPRPRPPPVRVLRDGVPVPPPNTEYIGKQPASLVSNATQKEYLIVGIVFGIILGIMLERLMGI